MGTVLTIGYERSAIEDFVATLRSASVEGLIDVREAPVSRKRGFSKTALAETLANAGVGYRHLGDLGNPKPGRDAAKRGDIPAFQRIFRAHLDSRGAQRALAQAIGIAAAVRTCLLCFERDAATCHRAIVAQEMANRGAFRIRHLIVRHGLHQVMEDGARDAGLADDELVHGRDGRPVRPIRVRRP